VGIGKKYLYIKYTKRLTRQLRKNMIPYVYLYMYYKFINNNIEKNIWYVKTIN